MKIYIKIGTMPARVMYLCRKRKLPIEGETVLVKDENSPYLKEDRVLIDGTKETASGLLFLGSRM